MSNLSSPISTSGLDVQTNLSIIQQNWSLPCPPVDAIPYSLRPGDNPLYWPQSLVQALRELSDISVHRPERAHSLLDTYAQARFRERRFKQVKYNASEVLEFEDVRDAIRSLKIIMRGQAMERLGHPSPSNYCYEKAQPKRKRKYNRRNEYNTPYSRPVKVQRVRRYDEQGIDGSPLAKKGNILSISSDFANYSLGTPDQDLDFSSNLSQYSPVSVLQDGMEDLSFLLTPVASHCNEMSLDLPVEPSTEFSKSVEPISPTMVNQELRMRRLELEEAQADLELTMQKHMVAMKRVEVAKLEVQRREPKDIGSLMSIDGGDLSSPYSLDLDADLGL